MSLEIGPFYRHSSIASLPAIPFDKVMGTDDLIDLGKQFLDWLQPPCSSVQISLYSSASLIGLLTGLVTGKITHYFTRSSAGSLGVGITVGLHLAFLIPILWNHDLSPLNPPIFSEFPWNHSEGEPVEGQQELPIEPKKKINLRTHLSFSKKPRTQKELIKVAQKALEEWKQDRSKQHDIGRFLIEAEMAAEKSRSRRALYGAYLERWEEGIETIRTDLQHLRDQDTKRSWEDDLEFMIGALFDEFPALHSYQIGKARITGILGGGGGKCNAHCRTEVSAGLALPLTLPPGYLLALQRSENPHCQAIVYDQKEKRLRDPNIPERNWSTKIEATIFDPHVIYHGYLKALYAQGIREAISPLQDEDFILAEPNMETEGQPVLSRSDDDILMLPSSKGFLSNLPNSNPEEGYTPNPYRSIVPSANRSSGTALVARSLSSLPPDSSFLSEMERSKAPFIIISNRDGNRSEVLFRTDEEVRHYNEEGKDFYFPLLLRSLDERFSSSSTNDLLRFLEDPTIAMNYPLQRLWEIFGLLNQISYLVTTLYPYAAQGSNYLTLDRKEAIAFFRHHHPLFRTVSEKAEALHSKMTRNPEDLILLLDQLSQEQRDVALTIFSQGFSSVVPPKDPRIDALQRSLRRTIEDPTLFGIGDKVATRIEETDKTPEVIGNRPQGFRFIRARLEIDPKRKIQEWADQGTTRHRISAATLLDLIFYTDARRWNERLTDEIIRSDRKGRYDDSFIRHCFALNRLVPLEARTHFITTEERQFLLEFGFDREDLRVLRDHRGRLRLSPDLARALQTILKRQKA
ncbi:MAG: hypothetical protein HYT76_07980 [Deltaproteobacteria bacterium]|nr:hypothetical protein [Deltaproteobacteria bacterium]